MATDDQSDDQCPMTESCFCVCQNVDYNLKNNNLKAANQLDSQFVCNFEFQALTFGKDFSLAQTGGSEC